MSDTRTSQPPPDEAKYREQVLERFATRSRSLTNQFTILMIFAFGFLVFIIVPLAELNLDAAHVKAQEAEFKILTAQSKELKVEHATQEQEIEILRGKITSLTFALENKRQEVTAHAGERERLEKDLAENRALRQQLQEQAKILETTVKSIETTLASFDTDQRVDNLRNWFSNTAFGSDRDPECDNTDRRTYLRCLVKKKLEVDWQRDFALIRGEIVEPLRGIAPEVAEAIEGEILAVRKTFGERLRANRDFWQSITGKELFMDGLSEDFNQAFRDIGKIVNLRLESITQRSTLLEVKVAELARTGQTLINGLELLDRERAEIEAEAEAESQELAEKEAASAENERRQAELTTQIAGVQEQINALPDPEDIEKERAEIEERLAGFESPFGAIPIGLKEAVLAYPLILAAGFMACTLLLSRLLALRREFRVSLARDRALSEADVDRRVATLAPLWFDAGRSFWGNLTLVLTLLIPFILFVAAGWLILNDWLLPLGDTISATNLRTFYSGLYGFGLVIFASGLFRVQSAWAHDRAGTAPANPTPAT